MTRLRGARSLASLVASLLLVLPAGLWSQASPPPFNAPGRSVKMPCAYCHSVHGGTVKTMGTAAVEALCLSCHNGTFTDPVTGKTAALVATHYKAGSTYGTYRVSCLGCHSAHYDAKAAGSEAVNPLAGYGNWMLVADRVREASSTDGVARIRRPAIVDTNGNNSGTSTRRYEDDVMDGYYCSNAADIDSVANAGAARSGNVVTIKTTTSHRYAAGDAVLVMNVVDSSFNGSFTITTTPTPKSFTYGQTGPSATSGGGVTKTVLYDHAACLADPPSSTDLTRTVVFYDNRATRGSQTQWVQLQMNPPQAGGQWYNGACNACHTRTKHHRRDNSGGDHDHNYDRACTDCHLHTKGWIK